jgi:N utilization substance protein B
VGKRRAARESALRILYEIEFNDDGPESVLARESAAASGRDGLDYSVGLVRGVCARRGEIDALIESTSVHWRIARMAPVDRNILRIAVFEMLEERFLAPAIVINEAIEIARRFSGEAAAQFVNGVLDAVRIKLAAAAPAPAGTTATGEKKDHGPKTDSPRRAGRGSSRTKK